MDGKRRDFFKQAGVAGALVASGGLGATQAQALGAGTGAKPGAPVMLKKMTFLTLRSGDQYSLGVKTEKGILDVQAAAKSLQSGALTSIDELLRHGDRGLTELVAASLARGRKSLFLDEDKIEFGPCVTNPEKILCVGLNYAKHARETNNPCPRCRSCSTSSTARSTATRARCGCRRCRPRNSTTSRSW